MRGGLKYALAFFFLLLTLPVWAGCSRPPTGPAVVTTSPFATPTTSSSGTSLPIITASTPSGTSFLTQSLSNGQRIYGTGTSDSGQPIIYIGGPSMMMMQGRLACITCHRPDGHGGTVFFMMQSFSVPDITWAALTAPDMDHPPYTEETLKQAITQGLDPTGNPLKYPMPRWQMLAQDLDDLIVYIKSLK